MEDMTWCMLRLIKDLQGNTVEIETMQSKIGIDSYSRTQRKSKKVMEGVYKGTI